LKRSKHDKKVTFLLNCYEIDQKVLLSRQKPRKKGMFAKQACNKNNAENAPKGLK